MYEPIYSKKNTSKERGLREEGRHLRLGSKEDSKEIEEVIVVAGM